MNTSYLKEGIAAAALAALALVLLNPFDLFMPSMVVMGIAAAALVVFGLFAAFVLREDAQDERDEANRTFAGRAAYLVGAGVMVVGVAVQSFSHAVDPWLVGGLVAMLLGKLGSRLYIDSRR